MLPFALAVALTLPIIGYHEVGPVPATGWGARTDDFVEQMELLQATGYHVVPIADAYAYLSGARESLPSRPVVLTVDDGWECAYTQINPVLERMHFPWSLYVYPAIIGHGAHALTWPQVLELAAHGVDVEDHTMTHAHLMHRSHPEMSDAQYAAWLHDELAASKDAIEAKVHHPVRFLAYPYGDHDAAVEAEAKRDGYLVGLTSESGLNTRATNLMELHRLAVISDTTLDQFRAAIGLRALSLSAQSPASGLLGNQRTLSAIVDGHGRFDASSVHIAILGETNTTSTYDAASGRVTITLRAPQPRQQVVVWADDKNGERYAAIWTLYGSAEARDRFIAEHDRLANLPLHHTQKTRH